MEPWNTTLHAGGPGEKPLLGSANTVQCQVRLEFGFKLVASCNLIPGSKASKFINYSHQASERYFDLTIVKKLYFPSYHTAAVLCCCAKLAFQKNNGEIAEATVGRTRLMIGTTRCKNEHYAFMKTLKLSVKNTKR